MNIGIKTKNPLCSRMHHLSYSDKQIADILRMIPIPYSYLQCQSPSWRIPLSCLLFRKCRADSCWIAGRRFESKCGFRPESSNHQISRELTKCQVVVNTVLYVQQYNTCTTRCPECHVRTFIRPFHDVVHGVSAVKFPFSYRVVCVEWERREMLFIKEARFRVGFPHHIELVPLVRNSDRSLLCSIHQQ